MLRKITCWLVGPLLLGPMLAVSVQASPIAELESAFADLNDANSVISTIDSGLFKSCRGKDRAGWEQIYHASRKKVVAGLAEAAPQKLSAEDARAVSIMKAALETMPETPSAPMQPTASCDDAKRRDLASGPLREALYACFESVGGNIQFEGKHYDRVGAMSALAEMREPERRKQLFLAITPLWVAVNGNDEKESPYRRMIAMAAQEEAKNGSALDSAARTVGVAPEQVERWLEQILEQWRQASGDQTIEPWDYYYQGAEADRELASAIPRTAMLPVTEKYYADLGADLKRLGVLYDLDPRSGKAPLAYTDYVVRGRYERGKWQPTVVRVSANYSSGGLGQLNEFVHENGHAVHMMALRARPAFMDLGSDVFLEAFADVPSWSTYEPSWQQKYLGRSAPEAASLRALLSNVMLDVAWSLFEIRMLHDPARDPNAVWTDITSRYLHVAPHPELSWWALRVQLVQLPGYMVNYGLGAVITADLRQRICEQLAPTEAGDSRWYEWISEHLLRTGEQYETADVLRQFLGRQVSPDALLAQIKRIQTPRGPLVQRINAIFADLDATQTPGAAVWLKKDEQVIFKRGYGVRTLGRFTPILSQTNFRLASCTKQFTAMAIMLLVHDGKLRYDEALTEVFPGFPAYGKAITIRNLLNHTSGLPDYEELMDKAGGDARWTPAHQIKDAEVLALLESETRGKFAPGTSWSYSNSGYVVLGLVVAKVSGKSFPDFLRERIFQPLGMNNTVAYVKGVNEIPNRAYGHSKNSDRFEETDQSSTSATLGDGGVYSNLEDLAKWDRALAQNTLLSAAEMQPALTPFRLSDGSLPHWSGGPGDSDPLGGKPAAYGFGWYLDPYNGHARMWHYGDTMGFKSAIERFPDDKLTVIVLANRNDADAPALALKVADLFLRSGATAASSAASLVSPARIPSAH